MARAAIHFDVKPDGTAMRVTLDGDIDERADFSELLKLEGRTVVLDLCKVGRINSAGCHRWVRFLEALAKRHDTIRLARLSSTFVAQALMIPNTVAHARIDSLFLTYWCDRCGEEKDVLSTSPAELARPPICVTCSQPLTPDAYASSISCLFTK